MDGQPTSQTDHQSVSESLVAVAVVAEAAVELVVIIIKVYILSLIHI